MHIQQFAVECCLQFEMTDENVADRLKRFIENEELTYSQFADRCGIPRPSLSQLLTGRNKKINDSMVRQIHNEFPKLSIVWLLFGEGDMIERETSENNNSNSDDSFGVFGGVFDENDVFSRKSGDNILKSPITDRSIFKNSKENALKSGANIGYDADSKTESLLLKIKELTNQIEKMKANPRKVTQITLYYDDSTFETFERTQK